MRKICNVKTIHIYSNDKKGGRNMIRTSYGMLSSIVGVREFTKRSSVDEYSEYYNWIHSNLSRDEYAVKKNKLEFLEMTFRALLKKWQEEMNIERCLKKLNLIDKNNTNREKLKKFIENSKDIYDAISSESNHIEELYFYYDDLSSWYWAQIDSTNKVLEKLSIPLEQSTYKKEEKNYNRL